MVVKKGGGGMAAQSLKDMEFKWVCFSQVGRGVLVFSRGGSLLFGRGGAGMGVKKDCTKFKWHGV